MPAAAAQPLATPASLTPQARQGISGFIVATQDEKGIVGLGDIVYLDRGTQHGVEVGDRFSVLQANQTVQHPVTHRPTRLPKQVLGMLTVIDVHEHVATALVTASQREISPGAPVEITARAAAAQALDISLARQAELMAQAEDRLAQLWPCFEATHQALRAAEAAGATENDLAPARRALAKAELLLDQAKAALARGAVEEALGLLQTAQMDCLTAQELAQQTSLMAASRAKPESYSVVRGDTLWSIAAQEKIYRNPFMWPLIYKANRTQIRDPDRIFPRQILAIPRNYSPEEANTAIQRARTRGRWRTGDGPDMYILEGVRR